MNCGILCSVSVRVDLDLVVPVDLQLSRGPAASLVSLLHTPHDGVCVSDNDSTFLDYIRNTAHASWSPHCRSARGSGP